MHVVTSLWKNDTKYPFDKGTTCTSNILSFWTSKCFFSREVSPKGGCEMEISVDPSECSDLALKSRLIWICTVFQSRSVPELSIITTMLTYLSGS